MTFGKELLPWDIDKREPVVKAVCVEPSTWKQRRPASARPASSKRPPSRPVSATRRQTASARHERHEIRRPTPWMPSGKPQQVGRKESLSDKPKWCLDTQGPEGGKAQTNQRKKLASKVARPRMAKRKSRKRCQSAGALRSTVHEYSPDVMRRGADSSGTAASSARSASSWMEGSAVGEEIARLAQSSGASIVPEYTPRGTASPPFCAV